MNKLMRGFVIVCMLMTSFSGWAQSAKADPKHEKNVRDMVKFLEYMLNTLGDEKTPAQDKEIMVTQSYSKIFRDGKVQIEDDLAEKRNVITNKDVTAYLKDVDFFFTNVKFELNIEEIKPGGTGDKLFYKVKIARNINGKMVDGKVLRNTTPRYIEINYNAKAQELKIVSMYTNEFDEKGSLMNWWNSLSYEWQAIFRREINMVDSVTIDGLKNVAAIDSLHLAKNRYIQSIEPLAQLPALRYLNISGTQVNDLTPIRNLTELVVLDISKTAIKDITPLRYSMNLQRLNLNATQVADISILENLTTLQILELRSIPATDFVSLASLTDLRYLNVSNTKLLGFDVIQSTELLELNAARTSITDLASVTRFGKLINLNVDSTTFQQLTPVGTLAQLKVLSVNNTRVMTLDALKTLKQLELVYCDNTGIKQEIATAFMTANPNVLVVFDSKDLRGWWGNLSPGWRDIFRRAAKIGPNPSKEELAKVTNLDSINLSYDVSIQDLQPLSKLQQLKVLRAAKTSIDNLSSIVNPQEIRVLDISHTQVNDPASLVRFSNLVELRADNTPIQRIDTLAALKALRKMYIDQTAITNDQVRVFLSRSPECLVVYKTNGLQQWWTNLPDGWKQILQKQLNMESLSTREHLHRLTQIEKISFSGEPVDDLEPLVEFVRLKSIHFSGTNISSLAPLNKMRTLTSVRVNDNPIRDLSPLIQLDGLQELDISNTAIENLEVLHNLQQLTRLSCAGTKMKKLDVLERMKGLKYLDCSNTDVKQLDPIANLSLTELKVYNTRVTDKEVAEFKKSNAACKVTYYR